MGVVVGRSIGQLGRFQSGKVWLGRVVGFQTIEVGTEGEGRLYGLVDMGCRRVGRKNLVVEQQVTYQ